MQISLFSKGRQSSGEIFVFWLNKPILYLKNHIFQWFMKAFFDVLSVLYLLYIQWRKPGIAIGWSIRSVGVEMLLLLLWLSFGWLTWVRWNLWVKKKIVQWAEYYPENLHNALPKSLFYCLYCNKSIKKKEFTYH